MTNDTTQLSHEAQGLAVFRELIAADRAWLDVHPVRDLNKAAAAEARLDRAKRAAREWAECDARLTSELDVAGNPKLPLTLLEDLAIQACNLVKAWAESDRRTPFPEEAHMKADAVLMMAAQRRKGVR